jgi:hypothetical protein
MITLKINADAFKQHCRQNLARGLQRAGVYLHTQCVRAVNRSNTNRHKVKFTAKQSAGRGGQKTGTIYDNMHNLTAGAPPLKRTGFGQSQIVYEFNDNLADPRVRIGVGKAGLYMIFLELGTRRIKARPWLLAMLDKHRATMEKLMAAECRK